MAQDRNDLIKIMLESSTSEGDLVAIKSSGMEFVRKMVSNCGIATGVVTPPPEFYEDHPHFDDDTTMDLMLLAFETADGKQHEFTVSSDMAYGIALATANWIEGLMESGRIECPCGKDHGDG